MCLNAFPLEVLEQSNNQSVRQVFIKMLEKCQDHTYPSDKKQKYASTVCVVFKGIEKKQT